MANAPDFIESVVDVRAMAPGVDIRIMFMTERQAAAGRGTGLIKRLAA